jgi:hypothetical protein
MASPVGPGSAAGRGFHHPAGHGTRVEAALVHGGAVALVPGQDAGRAPGWPESSGKTQLAAWLAGSLWQSREVDLLGWVAAGSRASILSGYLQVAADLGLDHCGDAETVATRFAA